MTTNQLRTLRSIAILWACVTWQSSFLHADEAVPAAPDKVDFVKEIAPILVANCAGCHDEKTKEGGYSLSTTNALFTTGDSGLQPIATGGESELLRRLRCENQSERMPPDSPPLPQETIARIETWIKQGAEIDAPRDQLLSTLIDTDPLFVPPEHYPRALPISAVTAMPDGQTAIVGGYGEILFWNLSDSTLTARLTVMRRRITDIEVSKDGKYLAVASGTPGINGSAQLFVLKDDNSWQPTFTLTLPEAPLDMAISPDNQFTVLGTSGGSVILVDNAQAKEVLKLDSHAAAITAVAWSRDSSKFYSASRDRTAKSYKATNGEILGSFADHERVVGGVAESYNGAYTMEESGRLVNWMEGITSHIISQHQNFSPRVTKLMRVDNEILILEPEQLKVMRHVSEKYQDGTDKDGKPKDKWKNRFENVYQLNAQGKKLLCFCVLANDSTLKVFAGTADGNLLVWEPRQSKDIQKTLLCRP